MKILITGANGMLGTDLLEILSENHQIFLTDIVDSIDYVSNNVKTEYYKLDITDNEKTFHTISKLNPDIVIHTAAYSDVDGCEKNPELAYKINSLGTRNICVACQRFDTVLCYISTDYVFSGDDTPEDGYKEMDKTCPISVYGKSKYWGEFYVKHLLNKFYIIRTSSLFGKKRDNFISMIVRFINDKKNINVVEDQYCCPTYTKHLAKGISQLIEKPLYGIFHLTNSGGCSRYDVVKEIFKIMNKSTEITLTKREKIFYAKRPKDSRLNNYMWNLEGFSPLPQWQDAIKEFLVEYFL